MLFILNKQNKQASKRNNFITACICRLNLHEVQVLSDLADSPKQIITGLAMQATVATVTELVVLSSAVSFMTELKLIYKVDCHYLVRSHYFVLIVFVYFMKLQMKFRVISRIPFHVSNSANSATSATFLRSQKITGPTV